MGKLAVLLIALVALAGCTGSPTGPDVGLSEGLLLENAIFPCWSSDGKALICNRSTSDEDLTRVWQVSADGEVVDALFTDPRVPGFPHWMPDGQRIAYFRHGERGRRSEDEVVVRSLSGDTQLVWEVTWFWDDIPLGLSPDGTEVIYTDLVSGGPSEVRALDLSDGSTRLVCLGEGGAISPDGQWIAYCKGDPQNLLAVAPIGGGSEIEFEPGVLPAWTPDSEYIVFTGRGTSGALDLIIVSRDGRYRDQLTDDLDEDLFAAVSPQGDQVAYVKSYASDSWSGDIWILDLPVLEARPADEGAGRTR